VSSNIEKTAEPITAAAAAMALLQAGFMAWSASDAYNANKRMKRYKELGMDQAYKDARRTRNFNIGLVGVDAATPFFPASAFAKPATKAGKIHKWLKPLTKLVWNRGTIPTIAHSTGALPRGIETYSNHEYDAEVLEMARDLGIYDPATREVRSIPTQATQQAAPQANPQANATMKSRFVNYLKNSKKPEVPKFEAVKLQSEKTAYSVFGGGNLQGVTLYDVYREINNDSSMSRLEREALIAQIKAATRNAPSSTPIQNLLAGGLGGAIGYVISKYFGMGGLGKTISTLAGFGLGRSIHNNLNRPNSSTQGWRRI
jgi:hypothetical protein